MTRVLIGDFGAIVRLGLRDLLEEAGCEIVGTEAGPSVDADGSDVVADVVLLDLDAPGEADRARELSVAFPAMKVIALSSDGAVMQVFPPFHAGESYCITLSPDQLVTAARRT